MIITPNIRSNFFTNTHPLGCEKNIQSQIKEVKQYDKYAGPKNVLIIGGSSGYGLSSRISLAFGANANTVNVSFESEPRGKRTGSAGYWNNVYFLNEAKETNNIHKDFLGDAFSDETKERVTNYIKDNLGTIDLVIYSLAAGARKNNETGEVVRSQIKTIGETVTGNTIDIASNKIISLEIDPATEQEIKDTVFVMGGSDWRDWIHYLDQEKVLSQNVKTIAYTYIGGPTTASIYRNGTLGKAKEDLEKEASKLNVLLKEKYTGEALISSSKAVVSKASVFIPSMPIYVGCLFEIMKKHSVHETILQHKHRLFKDMVYGEKRILDKLGRIRLDHYEMDELIQKETNELMNNTNENNFMDINGMKDFMNEFYQIHGFNQSEVDYEKDLDLEELQNTYIIEF